MTTDTTRRPPAPPAYVAVTQPAARPGPPQGAWTYADYAALPDDGNRYEIINGVLYMTPAPNSDHQRYSVRLTFRLVQHVEEEQQLGMVFVAPYDVELAPGVVVQPDVLVVLNAQRDIITPQRIVGAPALVVEITSRSTARYDRDGKLHAYAAAGVREYWIADPAARTIEVLHLHGWAYVAQGSYAHAATLPSVVLPQFAVPVQALFPQSEP